MANPSIEPRRGPQTGFRALRAAKTYIETDDLFLSRRPHNICVQAIHGQARTREQCDGMLRHDDDDWQRQKGSFKTETIYVCVVSAAICRQRTLSLVCYDHSRLSLSCQHKRRCCALKHGPWNLQHDATSRGI